MESEGLLQEPAISPYPKPGRSSLCPPSNFSKIHFNIIFSSPPVFQMVPFPQAFPLHPCVQLSSPPYVLQVLPIITKEHKFPIRQ